MARVNSSATDVVIVGAGAAGGVYAATLAKAGKKVVILEAGRHWQFPDLVSSQLWARRLKWGGAPVLTEGANPLGHNLMQGSGTGGAALHHYGTAPRFLPETFEMKRLYGVGVDWGITYQDLRPWYDRVQKDVGLSGDLARETWAAPADPYPMRGMPMLAQGEIINRGFAKLGKQTAPLPAVINTEPYKGRAACIYDGWCDAGCPIGALGNPLATYLGEALSHGAQLKNHCAVTRVLTDSSGRATGVEYIENGQRRELQAAVVILAASIVQIPRIMLNSTSAKHARGLGNSSGLVGRYLDAEVMAAIYGLFEEDTQPYLGVSAGQLIYRAKPVESHRQQVFGGYQWQIAPAAKPNDIFGVALTRPDLFGADLDAFVRRASHHLGSMMGFGSTWGEADNRVELSDRRDADGMPLAKIVHQFSGASKQLWQYLIDEGQAVFHAAGATEVWTGGLHSGHTVGGAIMGRDPQQSVADSYGRCHDVDNVFVSGGSLLPNSSGTSPTFTVLAVGLRAATFIVDHWSDLAA